MGDYELVQQIVEGEFPKDSTVPDHKGQVTGKLFEKLELNNVQLQELCDSSDDISRVFFFKRFFQWIPFSDDHLQPYRKSLKTANIFREIGKAAQVQKNMKEALKYYNLAVAFTPYKPHPHPNEFLDEEYSKDFIETVLERSAILLKVRGGEEALRDANFLLGLLGMAKSYEDANGWVKGVVEKVKEVQSQSLKFLEEKACFMLELAKDSVDEMERRRKYKNLLLFKIKKPHPLIPSAEAFLDIKVDPIKGRSLVLNRDIPAGTTVVVEEPFVKVLKEGLKWDMQHCHFCLLKIRGGGGIPCPACVFEVYCSVTCRQEALAKYHRHECPCLPYLHFTSTPRYVHLAFRVVCTLGPKALYRLFITKDPKYFQGKSLGESVVLGCDPGNEGLYSSSEYLPIYHLVAHNHSLSELEGVTNVVQGLIFSTVLDSLSTFFDELNYLDTHPRHYFRTFVASVIVHHMENIPPNSISVDELMGLEGISLLVKEPTTLQERVRGVQRPQYASATYALSSLINHSCDPNVTRVHDLTHARMALVTLKGLKEGEELLTSYTKIFLADTVEERRDYLKRTYNFTCDCIPCIQKWPILAKISETEAKFCCSNCTRKLPTGDKASPAFVRCILDKKGFCRSCKKGNSLVLLRDQLDQRVETFFEAYELILKNKPLEAIRLLGSCAQFFQDNVCPPYNKIYMSQDLLKTALDLVVHFSVPRT